MRAKPQWVPSIRPSFLFALLLLLALLSAGISFLATPNTSAVTGIIAFVPVVPFGVISYIILSSSIPTARYWRILTWSAVGAVGLVVVTIGLILSPDFDISLALISLSLSFVLGGSIGLLIGFNEARAIERTRLAERNRLEAQHTREQKDRLERLNHLLRHDILNNMLVIQGHTEFLLEDSDHDTGHAKTVLRQAEATTDLIQNVRTYLESVNDQGDSLERKNLSEVIGREVATLEASFPEATVDTDVPEEVYVCADGLVGSVFSNLLRNAVVHNDASNPHVRVSVSVSDDVATVRVSDDGPGLTDSVREQLFDAGNQGDHGFGLFLVRELVDQYNGSVYVEWTGDAGSVFTVELPIAGSSPEIEA